MVQRAHETRAFAYHVELRMNYFGNKWTMLLVLISLSALAVEYKVVQFGSVGVSIGVLAVEDVRFDRPMVLTQGVIATLAFLLVQHARSVISTVCKAFQGGYVSAPPLVELVRMAVANAAGSTQFGASVGSFRAGLRRRKIDCGRFKISGGRLTDPVIVSVPVDVHVRALISGFVHAGRSGLLFTAYAPIALALWAIGELVI